MQRLPPCREDLLCLQSRAGAIRGSSRTPTCGPHGGLFQNRHVPQQIREVHQPLSEGETQPIALASVRPEFNGLPSDSNFETWKPISFTDRGDNNTFRFIPIAKWRVLAHSGSVEGKLADLLLSQPSYIAPVDVHGYGLGVRAGITGAPPYLTQLSGDYLVGSVASQRPVLPIT